MAGPAGGVGGGALQVGGLPGARCLTPLDVEATRAAILEDTQRQESATERVGTRVGRRALPASWEATSRQPTAGSSGCALVQPVCGGAASGWRRVAGRRGMWLAVVHDEPLDCRELEVSS